MNIKWTESTAHTSHTAHYNELFIGEVIARTDTTLKTLFEAFVSTAPMRNKPIGLCETLESAKVRVEEWAREQTQFPTAAFIDPLLKYIRQE